MRDGSTAVRLLGLARPAGCCSAALAATVGLGGRRLARRPRLRRGRHDACAGSRPASLAAAARLGPGRPGDPGPRHPGRRRGRADRRLVQPAHAGAAVGAGRRSRPWRWCSTRSTAGWPGARARSSALGAPLRHGGRRVPDPGAQRRTSPAPSVRGCSRSARRATRSWRPAGCCRGCARPVPPRYWRKVVAAIQGIVLTVAAAGVFPHPSTRRRARRCAGPAGRVVRPRGVVAVAPPVRSRRAARPRARRG